MESMHTGILKALNAIGFNEILNCLELEQYCWNCFAELEQYQICFSTTQLFCHLTHTF